MIAPNSNLRDDKLLRGISELHEKKYKGMQPHIPLYLNDETRLGTDENTSAFKVASCRDLMEFHIFPKLSTCDEAEIKWVCTAWGKWFYESIEYVDDHLVWKSRG